MPIHRPRGVHLPREILQNIIKNVDSLKTFQNLCKIEELKPLVQSSVVFVACNLSTSRPSPLVDKFKSVLPDGCSLFAFGDPGFQTSLSRNKLYVILTYQKESIHEQDMDYTELLCIKSIHNVNVYIGPVTNLHLKPEDFYCLSRFFHGVDIHSSSECDIKIQKTPTEPNLEPPSMFPIRFSKTPDNLSLGGNIFSCFIKKDSSVFRNVATLKLTIHPITYDFLKDLSLFTNWFSLDITFRNDHKTKSFSNNIITLESLEIDSLVKLRIIVLTEKAKLIIRNCDFPLLGTFEKNSKKSKIQEISHCCFGALQSFNVHSNSKLLINDLSLLWVRNLSITGGFHDKGGKLKNIRLPTQLEFLELPTADHYLDIKRTNPSSIISELVISANLYHGLRWSLVHNYRLLKRHSKAERASIKLTVQNSSGRLTGERINYQQYTL